ncbi:MAG: hypothetical protein AAGK09_06890 [Planctomycetota bacterium]
MAETNSSSDQGSSAKYPPIPEAASLQQPDWEKVAVALAQTIRNVVDYHCQYLPGETYRAIAVYHDDEHFQINLDTPTHFRKAFTSSSFAYYSPTIFLDVSRYEYCPGFEEPYGLLGAWDEEQIYSDELERLTDVTDAAWDADIDYKYRRRVQKVVDEYFEIFEVSLRTSILNAFQLTIDDGTIDRFNWIDDAVLFYVRHDWHPMLALRQRSGDAWIEPAISIDRQCLITRGSGSYLPQPQDRVSRFNILTQDFEQKRIFAGLQAGDLPEGFEPWKEFYSQEIEATNNAMRSQSQPEQFSAMLDQLVLRYLNMACAYRFRKTEPEHAKQIVKLLSEQARIAIVHLAAGLPTTDRMTMLLEAYSGKSVACGAVWVDDKPQNVIVSVYDLTK